MQILRQDWKILLLIAEITAITRFFLLQSYPYVTVGDELRDAGFNALQIRLGETKDLFSFGAYFGYGNFIPLISYYFSFIFGNSALIYRLPSALVGIGSILLTYLVGKILGGKKVAIVGSFFLIGSFVHLHYSRTELVVILDSLLSIFVLLSTYAAILFPAGYFLTGLIFGLTFHFYAGLRGVVIISLLFLILINVIQLIILLRKRLYRELTLLLKQKVFGFLLLFIGVVISIGPTLNNYIKYNRFFQQGTAKLLIQDKTFLEKNISEKLDFLCKRYEQAFLVYFSEPAGGIHFARRAPLLAFPVNWFFLAGLFYLLLSKKNLQNLLTKIVIFTFFLFLLTNQVVLEYTDADHRLLSIFPYIVVIAAYGCVTLAENLTSKYANLIITLVLTVILSQQLYFYYIQRPSDLKFQKKDYLLEYMLKYIRDKPNDIHHYILNRKGSEYDLDALHYLEKIQFDTWPKNVELVNIADDNVTLSKILDESKRDKRISFYSATDETVIPNKSKMVMSVDCSIRNFLPNYYCPINFSDRLSFYVYE